MSKTKVFIDMDGNPSLRKGDPAGEGYYCSIEIATDNGDVSLLDGTMVITMFPGSILERPWDSRQDMDRITLETLAEALCKAMRKVPA